MEMFLMVLCVSVLGLGVAVMAFGAATRSETPTQTVQPVVSAKVAPARFFSDHVVPAIPMPTPQIPIEVLLHQIESHVRLEQAAAESFVNFPTHDVLHSKTTSPFVN
ncbi:MAG TPA: hypothetical protein VJA94_25760 [Candidatus Angelobacter sp.]